MAENGQSSIAKNLSLRSIWVFSRVTTDRSVEKKMVFKSVIERH